MDLSVLGLVKTGYEEEGEEEEYIIAPSPRAAPSDSDKRLRGTLPRPNAASAAHPLVPPDPEPAYVPYMPRVRTRTEQECPYCPKIFWDRAHFMDHIRTHTREKPFPCEQCTKNFATKGNLYVLLSLHLLIKF
jgi:uncharacterized Zn-finger protein